MDPQHAFILIHSPLVGPLTWELVANKLSRMGLSARVPDLRAASHRDPPFWQAHVQAVLAVLDSLPHNHRLVLTAHSGAGVLLPALRQAVVHPVAGCIFVDADLPREDASRLDLFANSEQADAFRQAAIGGLLPTWSERDLLTAIPEPSLLRQAGSTLMLLGVR